MLYDTFVLNVIICQLYKRSSRQFCRLSPHFMSSWMRTLPDSAVLGKFKTISKHVACSDWSQTISFIYLFKLKWSLTKHDNCSISCSLKSVIFQYSTVYSMFRKHKTYNLFLLSTFCCAIGCRSLQYNTVLYCTVYNGTIFFVHDNLPYCHRLFSVF